MAEPHDHMVAQQFSAQAAAYVTSPVHARGEDLTDLVARIGECRHARVLDLGCGAGHVSFHLAPQAGGVIAYDLSPSMLQIVEREAAQRGLSNIATAQGGVEKMPFASGSFDWVVSRYSAHHWSDLRAGLREARRVLAANGRAVFIDVVTPGLPLLDTHLQTMDLLRDPSHLRNYSIDEWVAALQAAGLQPEPPTRRRIGIDFASWVQRMGTPPLHVQAIRSLQSHMPAEVLRHFAVEPDGSFMLDTVTIAAVPIRP